MTPDKIPTHCDVLVIGAGPAGSACARQLAMAGHAVLLVDQHDFPRDKVCGDGLIPDAHAALHRLGVYDEVAQLALHVPHVRCIGPRGGHVDVPGTLSVLPRRTLDLVLVRHAERAGAQLLTPLRFEAPLLDGERVVGARFKTANGPHEISARWVVLATGAVPQGLIAAGLCERHTPSGVALRGYIKHEGLQSQIRQLQVVWHPKLRGGYGWIFPAPGGVFNIGAGLTGSYRTESDGKGRKQGDGNLRRMLEAFGEVYAPAGELLKNGQPQGEIKGAPLRCSMRGARWSRPGLLVTGEAAGSTYAFTGEGIGKAMETGLLAAETLHKGLDRPEAELRQQYETGLKALVPKFDLYDTGSRMNHHPWIVDIVIWRARKRPGILRRMSGLLEETVTPGHLFSWRGVSQLMFG
jgi:menaquinone-9 beta-reductase